MKLKRFVAVAAFVASPAFAAQVAVDFEKVWDAGNGSVDGYYGGGTAADGTSGPNAGVKFVGASGLSNGDNLGPIPPNNDYYANAPSPLGVMYIYDPAAVMNVAAGIGNHLAFWYSSPLAVHNAIQAWSGLDGTGSLLGSFDLAANDATFYDDFTKEIFDFSGTALSFSLGNSISGQSAAGVPFGVLFDNIAAAPEPETYTMLLGGLGLLGLMARRRKRNAA